MTACERQLLLELAGREVTRSAAAQGNDPEADKRLRYLIGRVQDRYQGEVDPWAVVPIL
jgi:hypothetical protein